MRRDTELLLGAAEIASWLWDNREQFRPLQIVRIDPGVTDHLDGLIIRLTVVLGEPADPDEDWPVGAVPALREAALSRAGRIRLHALHPPAGAIRRGRMIPEATGLRPDRLLTHVRQLTRRGSDTSAPRTVHARRAVSAAYYAVFHRVTINLARRESTGLPESVSWALCRTFSHTRIAEATELMSRRPDELRRSTPSRTTLTTDLADRALDGPGMPAFAHGFGPLQVARHEADYDHTTPRPSAGLSRPTGCGPPRSWSRSSTRSTRSRPGRRSRR